MRTALAARDIRTVLALLQERGMSQRALAERTGFSQGEIHEILRRGRRVLSYDVLARVADMLPVARWRMGLSAEPPADPGCPRCTKARGSPPPVGADTDAPTPPRGRSLEPPPRWWNQPNVLTALAAHDFRTVFGHLRALGLTSYDIATRTGLRPSPVDSVVAGCGGITAYDDILAVCHGLGIDRGAAGIAYLDPTGPSAALDERSGQEPGLPQAWTGMHTRALRLSMRHTVAGFAARANVSDRTIQLWESGAAAVRPRREIQWRLDAIYTAQPPHTRALYAHLLAEAAAGPPDPGSPR